MSKKYILQAIVDGDNISFNKEFKTRQKAIDYMFNYYVFNENQNVQLFEEYYKENTHDVEYILDNGDRFFISRIIK